MLLYFHVSLFPCQFISMLCYFHVILFPCYFISMLFYFHVIIHLGELATRLGCANKSTEYLDSAKSAKYQFFCNPQILTLSQIFKICKTSVFFETLKFQHFHCHKFSIFTNSIKHFNYMNCESTIQCTENNVLCVFHITS